MKKTLGKLLVTMNKQLARLYYDPRNPSAFSTLAKLQADVRKAKGKSLLHAQRKIGCSSKIRIHFTSRLEKIFSEPIFCK
jgi:hypothetical protein